MSQFYELSALKGQSEYLFSQLRNKVVLIVNVASLCGFSPQYDELQHLYDVFPHDEFEILAFPCHQFGDQELDNFDDIREYVASRFKVSFPILSPVQVNGEKTHPVFKYIKEGKSGFLGFKGVRWNFEKFLIDPNGVVVGRFLSGVAPALLEPVIQMILDRKRANEKREQEISAPKSTSSL
ncbi:hypothetical protein PUMCH_003792 [Australozyma saopauloensis]|uniref:Glutathione peroxidase n=1 Tax=Australozyma saopauloensis TaxID=291208 RepID=A0AAX4HCU4_9ASCO|nr:hypothetical protein PUMCH_003792 [[Candida] saopauloensis]